MVIALVLGSTTTDAGVPARCGRQERALTGPACTRRTPVYAPSSSTAVALLDAGLPRAQHAEGGADLALELGRRASKLRVWCRMDLLDRDELHAVGLGLGRKWT